MEFFIFISEQWLLVSLLMVLIYVFAFMERYKSGKPITVHEVTSLLNTEKGVLVDLREAKEFNEGHITGAIHIPQAKFASRQTELDKHKEKIIVLADKVGQQAAGAGKLLTKSGFQVRRLSGGVAEWSNQNLPLVKKK